MYNILQSTHYRIVTYFFFKSTTFYTIRLVTDTCMVENEFPYYLDNSTRPLPQTTHTGARLNNCHNASAFLQGG